MNEFKHNGSKSFNTYCFEIIPVKAFTFDLRGLYILHIVRVTMPLITQWSSLEGSIFKKKIWLYLHVLNKELCIKI